MNPTKHVPGLVWTRAPRPRRRFLSDAKGTAALEFALIAPIMIAMFFGTVEVCDAFIAKTKVSAVASTAGDLVAQEKNVCDADMTDVFNTLSLEMSPYDASSLTVVISSLVDDGNNGVTVSWSDAHGALARTVGSAVTIPSGLVVSGSGESVVMAEVTYTYTPPAHHFIREPISFTNTFYLHPRKVAEITRSVSCS